MKALLRIALLLALCGFADGKFELSSLARLATGLPDPKDIAEIHTDVFEQLAKKYSETKPRSKDGTLDDVKEIMYSYCDYGDVKCKKQADDAMTLATQMLTDRDGDDGDSSSSSWRLGYPDGMHESLTGPLDGILAAVARLDKENFNEIHDELVDWNARLDELTTVASGVNPLHHFFAKAASDVAIESAKFWHPAYYDDSHPLHHLAREEGNTLAPDNNSHNNSTHRELQLFPIVTGGLTVVSVVVLADILGVLAAIALVGVPFLFVFSVISLPALIPFFNICYLPVYLLLTVLLGLFTGVAGGIALAFLSVAFSAVGFVVGIPMAVIAYIVGDLLTGDKNSTRSDQDFFYYYED